jgi:hypothetical protein
MAQNVYLAQHIAKRKQSMQTVCVIVSQACLEIIKTGKAITGHAVKLHLRSDKL